MAEKTTTSYTKDSDYEITKHVVISDMLAESRAEYYMTHMQHERSIRKTFNFMAGKIVTVYGDAIYQASKYEKFSSAAATSIQTTVEYFTDQPMQLEIEAMHAELKKMGGKPPELQAIRAACFPGRKIAR